MQTGDYKFVKNLNEKLVLNLIRKHITISSSDLVRITGMRPSTIFNILKEFNEKGLVNNLGKGESTEKGGKKPFMWNLKNEAGYSVGIEVSEKFIKLVILNFTSELVFTKTIEIDVFSESKNLADLIVNLINSSLLESEINSELFLGIGIAIPGIINPNEGVIKQSEVIAPIDFQISKIISEKFSLPVLIHNNANTLAICEKMAGGARDSKHLVSALIKSNNLNNGIGIGLIIDEEIHLGSSFCAGEVNFALPSFSEILNSIRNEITKSEALLKFTENINELTIKDLIIAAEKGDECAISFFKKLAYFIGKALVGPIAIINPDTLVLGGDLCEVQEIIIDTIQEVLRYEVHKSNFKVLNILSTKFKENSVAIGAGAIILSEYFRVPNLENNRLELNKNEN